MDPPWAAVLLGISASPWSTCFSSDIGVFTAVSHSFPTSLPMWIFLPFLKYIVTEAPPALLMGSAVSCAVEAAGAGHGQLLVSSHGGDACSPPIASSLSPTPSIDVRVIREVVATSL